MKKCEGCGKFFLPSVGKQTLNIKLEANIEMDDVVGAAQDKYQGNAHPRKEALDALGVDQKGTKVKNTRRAREEDNKGTEENDDKRARNDCPRDDNPRGEQVKECSSSSSKKKRERGTDWYGVELFKSGQVQKPKNPYFVTNKPKNRPNGLLIPTEVIKFYNLELPNEIKLRDSKGRQFNVTLKTWVDGRTFYAGGWKTLCGVNFVKDDDDIICEFVNKGSDLCIHVSIVKI